MVSKAGRKRRFACINMIAQPAPPGKQGAAEQHAYKCVMSFSIADATTPLALCIAKFVFREV